MSRKLGFALLAVIAIAPELARAEGIQGAGSGRPRGFAMEVELAGTAPLAAAGLGGMSVLGAGSWNVAPRLMLGGQLGRFTVGGRVGMAVLQISRDDARDPTYWLVNIGPYLDFELWGSGPAAMFLSIASPVIVAVSDESYTAPGFSLDVAFGGRLLVGRWFSFGVRAGSRLDVLFWNYDGRGDDETSAAWSVYGALCFRFIASR